jgi:hypothetical protein
MSRYDPWYPEAPPVRDPQSGDFQFGRPGASKLEEIASRIAAGLEASLPETVQMEHADFAQFCVRRAHALFDALEADEKRRNAK